ncbi:Early nodulin-like protein 1 [Acorus calamus]|uniref:Early nodulin-like protein 1 n=1 Tax=Acorus calamus TaxID=4465 RepID=A0AAV9CPB2_ACOCL|nr:Early nodulin-like protein 1 [Acorus calamus]
MKLRLLLLTFFFFTSSLENHMVESFEFEVGDATGWVIPPANDTDFYNKWASKNRFKVGDTINFKYKKDSVMSVSEIDYDQCVSTHPMFFSNSGDTDFPLDNSGAFYFISGASGHCQKGQKLIIKVLGGGHSPPSGSPPSPPSGGGGNSSSTSPSIPTSGGGGGVLVSLQMIVFYVGAMLLF